MMNHARATSKEVPQPDCSSCIIASLRFPRLCDGGRYSRNEPENCSAGRSAMANMNTIRQLETVSIAEPLQNRQHAPLMLSTLGSNEKRLGG